MKKNLFFISLVLCSSCNIIGAGTLSTFQQWTLPVSKEMLDREVADLYKTNPEYLIPEKWKYLDTWADSGFGSLNGKIFYFKENPEEMYYISYFEENPDFDTQKDSKNATISVRAVNNGSIDRKWRTVDDYKGNSMEEKRINNRFHEEIILKLEKRMGVKSKKQNFWYEFFTRN